MSAPINITPTYHEDMKLAKILKKEYNIDFFEYDFFNEDIKKIIIKENRVYLFTYLLAVLNIKSLYKEKHEFEKNLSLLPYAKKLIIGHKAPLDILMEYAIAAFMEAKYPLLNVIAGIIEINYYGEHLHKIKGIDVVLYENLHESIITTLEKNYYPLLKK